MKVYRATKSGFITSINTDGNYKPPKWYKSYNGAYKHRNTNYIR